MCRARRGGRVPAAGDERDDDIRSVPVEVLAPSVVDRRGSRVGVTGGELYVAERHAGVERCHDEPGAQHVRMDVTEPGTLADRANPTVGGASVQTLPILAPQDRSLVTFADDEIHSACRSRDKRDRGRLVALAQDRQRAMPALEGQVLDVRSARFGDLEPVQAQQHRQRGMVAIEPFGGEQESAEFGAVHATTLVWLHLGTPHVLRGVRPDPAVDVSEAVEPAHRRQASVDRRCRQPSLLHPTAVQLDVRARRREHGEVGVRRPLEEPRRS